MWRFVTTDLLGPKGRSHSRGRISFLCYSLMMVQGLEWTPHFKAIYKQSWGIWAIIIMMLPSVTGGQDQCPNCLFFPFTLLRAFHCSPLFYHASAAFSLICLPNQFISAISPFQTSPVLFLPRLGRINNFLHPVMLTWCSLFLLRTMVHVLCNS